ncbi:MAG: ABC transporter permease subunit [Treponema sp.]|jgi:putative aldouronate transport system permease protein|nr:ABC transporter permease subunit [Treponema sp.]
MRNTEMAHCQKKSWNLFFLALPLMILVILFNYVPLVGWGLSLMEYRPGTPILQNEFVGLKNFRFIIASRDMGRVMKNTIILSGLNFILMICPIIFALLLTEITNNTFRRIVQTLTTLPHFISWVIVFSLAFSIFGSEGLVNRILAPMGLQQAVLSNPKAVYWFQSFLSQWKSVGWGAIIYIAAITGIDQELYEAAIVDGAGRLRCVWHITIPCIMPTILVLALLNIAGFVNTGTDQHFVFRNAIIMDNIETLDLYTYRLGMQLFDYSYATAVGIFKSVISITLLFITNNLAKRIRGEAII